MAGRVFGTNGQIAPVASSAGRVSWAQAQPAPGATPLQAVPETPLEKQLVSSFNNIDQSQRVRTLNNLAAQAKGGDKGAARKVQLLSQYVNNPNPVTPDFADKSLTGRIYAGEQAIGGFAKDAAKTAADSIAGTAQTIATVPHAVNALGIALATLGEHGDKLNKAKQAAINEMQQTPFGKYFGKTPQQQQNMSTTQALAGIGGKTLENVLNASSLGEGELALTGVRAGAKAVADKSVLNFVGKQAAKGEGGYIRNLASGQFARTAVHPDDASVMATFIDYARGLIKPSPEMAQKLELNASRIAEHYNIGGAPKGVKQLANAFDKVLSASPEALRNIGEAGHIGLPEANLGTKSANGLEAGLKYGAGYGVAQAGQKYVTDPRQLSGQVALSTALGGVAGLGGEIVGRVFRGAGPKTAGEVAGSAGVDTARAAEAPGRVEPAAGNATEPLTAPQSRKGAVGAATDTNLSSRAHQFASGDPGVQELVRGAETDSRTYRDALRKSGGDKVIGNDAVLQAAEQAGPLDHNTIINAKPLGKVDTLTLARAHATVEAAGQDLLSKWQAAQASGTPIKALDDEFGHFAKLAAGYKVMSGEAGRALQIQNTFIEDSLKAAGKLEQLSRETKGVTEEVRQQRIAQDFNDWKQSLSKAKSSGLLSRDTLNQVQRMVSEYATAAKLTSPMTHVINIVSNLATLPQRGAENVIRAGLGALRGETSLGEAKGAFGTVEGLRNATAQLGRDLKQAFNPKASDLGLEGKESQSAAIPGVAGKVIRTPFNALSAFDNFFKNWLTDSELHQSAYRKAYQEGFRNDQLASRISELVKMPTQDMLDKAGSVAKEFTFQSDPGPLAKAITGYLAKVPAARLLIPFVQTPTNIMKFQGERSVLGVFSPRNIKAAMQGGIERDEAIARLGVGTALSVGAYMGVKNLGDNITGAAPTTPNERNQFYAEGKKPYSIKIGDQWVQYNRVQPLGMYIAQAVGLRDALDNHDSKTAGNLVSSMVVTTAKSLSDLPFFSGLSNLINAVTQPTPANATKLVGGLVTGLIPNASRDIANAQDPTQRDAKTIQDQIKNVIPGLKQTLPASQDVFGRTETSANTPFERGVVKVVSKDRSNALTRAIDEVGQSTGYYPSVPTNTGKLNGKPVTQAQFDQYQARAGELFGQKLAKAIQDSSYQNLSTDDKKRTMQAIVTDARDQAAKEIVGKQAKNPNHKIKHY